MEAVTAIKEKAEQAGETIKGAVAEIRNVENVERIISITVGALFTYYGMQKKETMLGKGLTLLGGMLITRGTTGFCPVNQAIGRGISSL